MSNCKDCKYFKRYTDKDYWEHYKYNKKYGVCNNKNFVYGDSSGWGMDEDEKKQLEKANILLYGDYESYAASFEVGENFGCVHFRNKE